MIRAAIDARALGNGKGVSRFLESFLRAAAQRADGVELVVFVDEELSQGHVPDAAHIRAVPASRGRALAWDLWGFDRACAREKVDVSLTFSDRARTRVPRVFYLFEVPDHRIALARPTASRYQRASDAITGALIRRSLRSSARVVVSSNATAADLESYYGFPRTRAPLVYPAHDPSFVPADQEPGGPPTFLHVSSNIDARDNTPTVLGAFAKVAAKLPEARLEIAGVDRLRSFGWGRLFEDAGIRRSTVFLGHLSPVKMADAYRRATAYVDPSLYEGFGFQVAEAMACGTPVICSNRTSLPEITGEAGIVLDPNDIDGFAGAMFDVATRPAFRTHLRERVLSRAATFDWSRTCDGLLAALRGAATEVT